MGTRSSLRRREECGLYSGSSAIPRRSRRRISGCTAFSIGARRRPESPVATVSSSSATRGWARSRASFAVALGILEKLTNPMAIGHVRYSTTGSVPRRCNSQPLLAEYSRGQVAVAHNGNLINAGLLRDEYEAYGSIFKSTSDTEIIVHLLAKPTHQSKPDPLGSRGEPPPGCLFADSAHVRRSHSGGSRSVRDQASLCIGRTDKGGYVVASESCAIDAIGARSSARSSRVRSFGWTRTGSTAGSSSVGAAYHAGALYLRARLFFEAELPHIFGENVHHASQEIRPSVGPRIPRRGRCGDSGARFRDRRGGGLRRRERHPV